MKKLVWLLPLLLCLSIAHADSITVQQSTTSRKIVFLLVQSADHVTALTGATPTVTISKNGAAFSAPAGSVTELSAGWYVLTPTSADTGTVGALIIHATATNADPADVVENVVAYNPDDAAGLGLSRVDAAISTRSTFAGGAVASVTGSVGSVTGSVGSVTAGVTVATNGDKTGYSLASSQAFSNSTASTVTPTWYTAPTTGDTSGTTTLLTRIPGVVQPQTGDSFARLGAPAGASHAADIAGVLTATNANGTGITTANTAITGIPAAVLSRSLGHGLTVGQLLVLLQSDKVANVTNTWNASTHTLTTAYQFGGDGAAIRTDATVYPLTQTLAPPVQARTTTTGTVPQP